jgi:response regulator RpfG family c-di-GMP phosphodiesterase
MTPPRLLLVDDEPHTLQPLARLLRRRYEVATATDVPSALQLVGDNPDFAVAVSDLEMPGDSGIVLFEALRKTVPDCVRILLTGKARLDSAIAAVNQGDIFRFLQKPCSPELLLSTVQAGVTQHQLVVTERVLLEQTLQGSIAALSGVLALVDSSAFGRVDRLKRLVARLAERITVQSQWELEVATMLAEVGTVGLPRGLTRKLAAGEALSDAETRLADERPMIAARIIGSIPRLEGVREVLEQVGAMFGAPGSPRPEPGDSIRPCARILAIALDYERLENQRTPPDEALQILRGRPARYDREALDALASVLEAQLPGDVILEVPLKDVAPGMVFADDVRSAMDGTLMISRGQEATTSLVNRIQNYWTEIPITALVRVTWARRPVPESEAATS